MKYTKIVFVRVSEKEIKTIRRAAQLARMSVSAYTAAAVLAAARRPQP
jgi:uncharacterized protein (DUF1778 family)